MSIGDAFKNLGQVVQQFFADFLLKIAQAILQQMLLNALAGAGWGGVSSAATAMGGVSSAAASVPVKHSGGIVGGRSNRTRDVSPNWFANAPRFHDGGLPGLKRDEVPAILQKGEQVLSKDDPNNILNGAGQQAPAPAPVDLKIINTIDPSEVVNQGLSTASGQQAVINAIRGNKTAIKAMLK